MKYLFVAFLSMMFISCNQSADPGDPKAVVEKFVDAVSKKDMATARALCTTESQFFLNQMEQSMKKNEGGLKNFQFNRSQVEIGSATITGESAIVPVKELKSNEAFDVPLKKESGVWKVAFDVNSMITMAMKKMKEKGVNISDSIGSNLQSLKNLNIDSIKKELSKKGISMDSIKNEMKKRGISIDSLKSLNINID